MRGQVQGGPTPILLRDRSEDGADLNERVNDPCCGRRGDDEGINQIGHRAPRAGADVGERAPAINIELGTGQRVLDARPDEGRPPEQREYVLDRFHNPPSATSPHVSSSRLWGSLSMPDCAPEFEPDTSRSSGFRVALALPRHGPAGLFGSNAGQRPSWPQPRSMLPAESQDEPWTLCTSTLAAIRRP